MLQTNTTLPALKTETKAKNKSASVVRRLHGGKTRTPRLTSGEFDLVGTRKGSDQTIFRLPMELAVLRCESGPCYDKAE